MVLITVAPCSQILETPPHPAAEEQEGKLSLTGIQSSVNSHQDPGREVNWIPHFPRMITQRHVEVKARRGKATDLRLHSC